MLCIINESSNPFFNLASEEYLLKEKADDCFMLYRNDRAVIVGKHQNTLSEINYRFVKANNIQVVRRMSGGGAVYQDQGNLNFLFIRKNPEKYLVDFSKHISPVLQALKSIGIPAEINNTNEILLYGNKISGNAEHIYKNRVLHHGTLLFSADLDFLQKALNINPDKYKDKAVKSKPKNVANISEHVDTLMNIDNFSNLMMQHICNTENITEIYKFSETDNIKIRQIAQNKYNTWEWNYAYSPAYCFNNKLLVSEDYLDCFMYVSSGIIEKIQLASNVLQQNLLRSIEIRLTSVMHQEKAIAEILEKFDISPFSSKDMLYTMF